MFGCFFYSKVLPFLTNPLIEAFLFYYFADSAGKKGGEFYTPRAVVKLMVRIVDPREGMEIYGPCVGSGGMLILSKQHIEEHGGNTRNFQLYGQDNNGGVWAICKMNLLLHGIPNARIENEDTLMVPIKDGGKLKYYDRVLSNPPFSQNYSRVQKAFMKEAGGFYGLTLKSMRLKLRT
ncbi:N-6 DNA methylase [Plectonema cf. radiosum LEGE 06105]|uniref:site-specific DNA-methyltransferase (adenine-specific) n=1 Tax=Plectonema cf. radiosum LEGE 06105 TaxID=945769 RepID=A0A8J7JU47_9CYAN|nr:N-6 DNA methylase [Plectonema radiosum]MBE9213025.1 N-6 DNA methylase [Plectonema cf. radiosum LEGE 06105]